MVGSCIYNVSDFLTRYGKQTRQSRLLFSACKFIRAYACTPNTNTEAGFVKSVAFLCGRGEFCHMAAHSKENNDPLCNQIKADSMLLLCHALEIARRRGVKTDEMEAEFAWLEPSISAFPVY
jgi:hypothetical protein